MEEQAYRGGVPLCLPGRHCIEEDVGRRGSELRRVLKGVKLFISDACLGLIDSIYEFYPDGKWQRCVVHFYRNVFSVVPKGKVKEVAMMLKAIHASEDEEAARKKAEAVVERT